MDRTLKEKGRVLNRTNETLLTQAKDAIIRALASLRKDQAEDTDEADETAEGETAKAADATKKTSDATPKVATTSAKEAASFSQQDTYQLLQAALTRSASGSYMPYIQDIYEDDGYMIYRQDYSGGFYRADFEISEDGTVTVGEPVEVVRKVTYLAPGTAAAEEAPADDVSAAEAVFTIEDNSLIPLIERAVAATGDGQIKLIAPGKGSSGYYPAEVLQRDGPRVFPAGTKMFWDHATLAEEAERPEGSLDRFAAVLTSDAAWRDDPINGPGLYAGIKVREDYRGALNDIAPYIGTSIRAEGKARMGEVSGLGRLPIIEEISKAKSVDFVTTPGAGGKILELFESAKRGAAAPTQGAGNMDEAKVRALLEAERRTNAQRVARLEAENAIVRECARRNVAPSVERRVTDRVLAALALTEAGDLDRAKLGETLEASIVAEYTYLNEASGGVLGAVRGMGGAAPKEETAEDFERDMAGIFQSWGMSEAEAKTAAHGRG